MIDSKYLWTASRFKTLQMCPQKEAFRYRQNIAVKQKSMALRFGTAIHKGIELRDVDAGVEELQFDYPQTQEESDEQEQTRATVRGMLMGYMKTFQPFFEHHPEKEFDARIKTGIRTYSRRYRLRGKID